ncbi:MAG: hypothetical protein K6V36_11595 [Anaerolineae bacterium]|nr:hypothetical protein [Anaerolineae bacterium]
MIAKDTKGRERREKRATWLEAAGAEGAEAARARTDQLAGEAARLREQGEVALRQLRAQQAEGAEGAEGAGQRALERSLDRSLSGQTQSLSGTPSLRSSSGEAAGLTKQSRTSPPLTQPEGVQSSDQTHLPSVMQRTTPPPSSVGPTHTLGSMDPTSNRVVVQPHGDVDALVRGAAEQEGWLREHLSQAVEGVPGTRLAGVRTKELAEVQRKLTGKPAHTIPDYLGGRVVIDDLSVTDVIMPRLGRVVKDDASCDAPRLGYHTRHVQIELPNGMTPFSPRASGSAAIAKDTKGHGRRRNERVARRRVAVGAAREPCPCR